MSQIVALANIVTKIIKSVLVIAVVSIIERTYEFPVTMMYRHGRREPMGCGTMPWDISEHWSAVHLFASKCTCKVYTVNGMVLWTFNLQHAENGWIEIIRLNSCFAV